MFPTSCPDCGDLVYYFDCTCGSRVFFDHPGEPWPLHRDRCIPYLVRHLRDVERLPYEAIRHTVEEFARLNAQAIPAGLLRRLRTMEHRELGGQTILDVRPHDDEVVFEGAIVSANLQVNFLRRYGLPDNAMSRGLFGRLLKEAYAEVKVRGDRDEETGFISQFTFFMPLARYRAPGLRLGMRVGCVLKPHRLPNERSLWLATDVYPLR